MSATDSRHTAEIIEHVATSANGCEIVHAETDHDHTATLYYPNGQAPEVGKTVPVWFEMGGWCTDDSPIYRNREGYRGEAL